MIFAWDDVNRDHIAKHDVTPDEAEQVVRAARKPFPRAVGDGKYMVWGTTPAKRYLQVIFVFKTPEEVSFESLAPEQWLIVESRKSGRIIRDSRHGSDGGHETEPSQAKEISMAKQRKPKINENDFKALDRLAHSITLENTRPLNKRERERWESAKRGRPKKAPGTKAVPTLITVEPTLLKKVDAYAKKAGISRSQLFSEAVRRRIAG